MATPTVAEMLKYANLQIRSKGSETFSFLSH